MVHTAYSLTGGHVFRTRPRFVDNKVSWAAAFSSTSAAEILHPDRLRYDRCHRGVAERNCSKRPCRGAATPLTCFCMRLAFAGPCLQGMLASSVRVRVGVRVRAC